MLHPPQRQPTAWVNSFLNTSWLGCSDVMVICPPRKLFWCEPLFIIALLVIYFEVEFFLREVLFQADVGRPGMPLHPLDPRNA